MIERKCDYCKKTICIELDKDPAFYKLNIYSLGVCAVNTANYEGQGNHLWELDVCTDCINNLLPARMKPCSNQ